MWATSILAQVQLAGKTVVTSCNSLSSTQCQDEIVFLKRVLYHSPIQRPLGLLLARRVKYEQYFQALLTWPPSISLSSLSHKLSFPPNPAQHTAHCSDTMSSGVSPLCFAVVVSLPEVLFAHHHYLSQFPSSPNEMNLSTWSSGFLSNDVPIFLQLCEYLLCQSVITLLVIKIVVITAHV